MNYRNTHILAETDVGASGTKDMEIKIKDVISRITIASKVSKSKHTMDSYVHRNITKIELKGNGNVLFGMNGGQCQALNIYDRKCATMNDMLDEYSWVEYTTYGLDFGRYLFDPRLALDPKRFDSLILYVTFDRDVSDIGATALNMEVWADVFDEKVVSPQGFLRSLEYDSRTPPSSGYDYIKLPTDKTLRKLLLQGYRAQYEPWYQASEARLDEDNEKRIPFDWDLEDYYRVMHGHWTPVEEQMYAMGDNVGNYHYYVTPTEYNPGVVITPTSGGVYGSFSTIARGGYFTPMPSAGSGFLAIIKGYLPNHCFEFPFGDPMDIDDWYALKPEMDLRLRIKAGSGGANGTVATILQQLQRY